MPGCQTPNQHPCQHPNKCTHIGSPGRPAALRPACPSDPAPPWHMHRHCSCRQCRQQLASARGWWWMRVTCMCKSGAYLAGSADSNWHVRGHWDPPQNAGYAAHFTKGLASPVCYISYILYYQHPHWTLHSTLQTSLAPGSPERTPPAGRPWRRRVDRRRRQHPEA